MASTITILCYVTDYKISAKRTFQIVNASGILNSRSLNLPQKVFLKAFYLQNMPEEFNLATFDTEDIILITDPSNIPKFPVLINMTAMVQEPLKVQNDDAIIVVNMTDYVDQDNVVMSIDCYYPASAPHLV
ncbi:15017_t:CDS:2, partial [Cetraspora pellucida]